jgi:CBS domain-containing protein
MATIEGHVTRKLVALEGSASCGEAARLMDERRIGAIAVRDGGRVVGIVTERDLATRVLGAGKSADLPVREAMRRDVPSITLKSSEVECSKVMREHATRHLIVEETGEVVGIISMRDIIQLMLDDKQFLIEQLNTYINGH